MQENRSTSGRTLATIDIGTNSVLLTIARDRGDGQFDVVHQAATVTRLGQDVDRTGTLHPDAEARTLTCLTEYRRVMDEHGVSRGHAVGTSALRDAQGGPLFVEQAAGILGFAPEVISGTREAELTFVGALSGLPDPGRAFVFDIGGGSTELIVGKSGSRRLPNSIEQCTSLNLGSVRLTERHALSDPPSGDQILGVRSEVQSALQHSGIKVDGAISVIGVAGTVTTLAALSRGMSAYDATLIHGATLGAEQVAELAERLARMTVSERRQLPGLSPGRADVIGAGAILCDEILKWSRARELTVSDRGVRFGILAELLAE